MDLKTLCEVGVMLTLYVRSGVVLLFVALELMVLATNCWLLGRPGFVIEQRLTSTTTTHQLIWEEQSISYLCTLRKSIC